MSATADVPMHLKSIARALDHDDHLSALQLAQKLEKNMSTGPVNRTPASLMSLVDSLAAHCFWKHGSLAGYDSGRVLVVRPPVPGTEWLGRSAAPDPSLDDPTFYTTPTDTFPSLLGSDDMPLGLPWGDTAAHSTPPVSAHPPLTASTPGSTTAHSRAIPSGSTGSRDVPRVLGYRCLADAVRASRDGDMIHVLPGTHPSGGGPEAAEGIRVDKRVLIRGWCPEHETGRECEQEGLQSGPGCEDTRGQGVRTQVVLEHRSNTPLLRLTRGAVVCDLTVDMVGFREAVRCEGGDAHPHAPLLLRCNLISSGGDALHVTGAAQPLLLGCTVQGHLCGARLWSADATPHAGITPRHGFRPALTLLRCAVSKCGEAAIAAEGDCGLTLDSCKLSECEGEGLLLLGRVQAQLSNTHIMCTAKASYHAVIAAGACKICMKSCHLEGCTTCLLDRAELQVLEQDAQASTRTQSKAILKLGRIHAKAGAGGTLPMSAPPACIATT